MTWATHEKLLANNTSHDKIGTFQPQSAIHQEIGLLMLSALKMRTSVMTESAINSKYYDSKLRQLLMGYSIEVG
jgi:hypothetical protein